jgi:crotonobetaine/carnitine-CoA ligase
MGMIYTSGTTGLPKGVILPHFSYISTALHFSKITGITKKDRLFSTLPLFHCGGQHVLVMPALLNDIDFAMEKRFSASQWWNWVRKYGATILVCAGTIVPILYKQEKRKEDSDNPARLVWNAGTAKEIWKDFEKRFGLKIIEVYGLTETGCAFTSSTNVGAVGRLHDDRTIVEIVNDDDEILPPYQKGEIVVRPTIPYSMMLGYHNKPELVVNDWRNLWFHTGDIGYKDEEGFLYFVERKAHFIRRRGENISSFEVEQIINECPKVLESAVIGVPSELGEEEVKAYIVLQSGQEADPREIIDWCSQRMAYFKIPRYVEFVPQLPKTSTNRVERFKLKGEGIGKAWDREVAGYVVKK